MARRRTLWLTICFLGLVLLGTVIVLSTTSYYLAINDNAYIDEQDFTPHPHHTESKVLDHTRRPHYNASAPARIPRIIHQTWKSEALGRWATLAKGCRDMHPDYEYMLWTDAKSREFIAKEYPWFLDTFDDYKYPIQRADAIRYFVLHHYGGVYLDLDVGCLRPVDPLLSYSAILPKTIPVGVSNDLMFAEKGHPFMAQTIHNLVTFDHSWYLNYPTVMFSTGPMFLSAQYGIYTTAHPPTPESPGGDVRILPKALYGKNARPGEAPHAFFEHYYGSSWHDDDAAFVGFLATWGKALMVIGTILTVCGAFRLSFPAHRRSRSVAVVFPRWSQRRGRWQLGLGDYTLSLGTTTHPPSPEMPASPTSSMMDDDDMFTLSLPMDVRSSRAPSPAPSDRTDIIPSKTAVMEHPVIATATDVGRRVAGFFGFRTNEHRPRRRDGRVLFTVLAPSDEFRSRRTRSPPPTYSSLAPSISRHDKSRSSEEAERGELDGLHPREGYVPSSRAVTPSGSPDPSRPGSPPRPPPQTHELDESFFGAAGRPPARASRHLAP